MHSDDPYTIVPPRSCLVETPEGLHEGLVIGERGLLQLVLIHRMEGPIITWVPSEGVSLVGRPEWAPWSSAVAANA